MHMEKLKIPKRKTKANVEKNFKIVKPVLVEPLLYGIVVSSSLLTFNRELEFRIVKSTSQHLFLRLPAENVPVKVESHFKTTQ